ncbi:MAG: putative DNA binding domain-containing protein [Paludibacteraceae bacterium]|nr:putative DNA binding domain-containing protein [Paludibacteraceae bacterium]
MNNENQNIEYKESWRDEHVKWLCGFANAQGGKLYIGVNDKGEVCGVENAHKLSEDIPNKVVSFLGIVADVYVLNKDGKDYIEIAVAPSYVPISYKGKYYVRSGSTLQELNGAGLQNFVLKKMGNSWDDMVNEHATVDDLDREAIDYFLRKGIEAGRINSSEANAPTKTVLQNLGLLDEQEHLKNAALLLFSKNPRRYFAGTEFKIGRFHSNIADLTSQEMIEGSIIQMADRVVWMLKEKFLTMPIHYEGLQRIEQLEVPEDALREIIYNAICHKDYFGPQIQMRVWDHHVEIWNYGELPEQVTPENIETNHASYPRNKNLAFAFYKAGFIESWGRGWQKICDGFQAAGLPKPTIESKQGGVLVTFQRNNVNLKMTDGRQIGSQTGTDVVDKYANKLTERQQLILKTIRRFVIDHVVEGVVEDGVEIPSARSIAMQLGTSPRTIQRELAYLQSQNIIIRRGNDYGGYWEIIE